MLRKAHFAAVYAKPAGRPIYSDRFDIERSRGMEEEPTTF